MKIPKLKIGDIQVNIPIIQGAMGVGVSGPNLAAAVANAGGIGVLSGVGIGYTESDYNKNPKKADLRALINKIRTTKKLAPKGFIGINFLVAMNNYAEMVKTAVSEGIDLIISGAGLPTQLPKLTKGTNIKLAPIVSSAKAAKVITRYWDKNYNKIPDMVIVEGTEAGGHLGFKEDILKAEVKPNLTEIVKQVITTLKPFEQKYNTKIPVIAAGGVFTGEDIAKQLQAGASGVQMATRFVVTEECDADQAYKDAYLSANKEDIKIIKSPVGLPGRALNNSFIKKIAIEGDLISKCSQCLQGCNPLKAPYCISKALINAVKGDIDKGLIFVGSNAYKLKKMTTVPELLKELMQETRLALKNLNL
ncbi:nitronate monooxygenase [Clostridium sp. 'deep sea']|uniref:NAD(P)H-dependent flavin oxidoreductase n=1 Tax=Clostridium sp. 'deep sea' TaxID=2779445 RepID=UPI0018966EE9|nr:nitronate monooxygenase [Clostridium sp. 'deep sea']QOR33649.1 nitronate monooxygenase [Clostridium sp. 'deep sea']